MSLRSFFRAIDPTRAGSVVRRGLRQLDPTLKSSAMAGIGRQLDVTNKNSIAGKVAPYAVGLIPGIGLPLAAGLGAGRISRRRFPFSCVSRAGAPWRRA